MLKLNAYILVWIHFGLNTLFDLNTLFKCFVSTHIPLNALDFLKCGKSAFIVQKCAIRLTFMVTWSSSTVDSSISNGFAIAEMI